MFCCCQVRDEELEELDRHQHETCCLPVAGGSENNHGKVNILLQTYISRGTVDAFSLVSDSAYVAQVGKLCPVLILCNKCFALFRFGFPNHGNEADSG